MARAYRSLIAASILFACSSDDEPSPLGPDPEPARTPFPAEASAELAQALEGIVARGVAPGVSVAVEVPGYEPWSRATGIADLSRAEPLGADHVFRAGSMLKPLIATSVLQQVEQGQLSLDATLPEVLPASVAERIPEGGSVTVRMLLGHRSGFPDYVDASLHQAVFAEPTHIWTLDEVLERAFDEPLLFAPGNGWAYSNTNYVLLGEISQHVTGRPWRESVRDDVFARAELSHSRLPEEGDASCAGCSRGYEPMAGQMLDLTEVDPSMAGAAGGAALVTTPADLARFIAVLASGALFDDPATLTEMLEFTPAEVPEEMQTSYGLGLARFQLGDTELIGHLGATAGFQGFVFFEPGSGMSVSGYMNQRGDFGAFIVPVLEAVGRLR